MYIYLLIALGGALGSVARHGLANFITVRTDSVFPWGTFWVNVSGCLADRFLCDDRRPERPPFREQQRRRDCFS